MTKGTPGFWSLLAVLAALCLPLTNAQAVPSAPTTLIATAVSASQIDLRWADTSTNERGFRVERRIGSGAWRRIATLGANATTFANVGLKPATTYAYRVLAYHRGGLSAPSNLASATTTGGPSPPAAPTGLRATVSSASRVKLTWRDHSRDETGFYVERRIGTGAWSRIATLGANQVAYVSRGLTGSTTYWYRVQAYRAKGGTSGYSNEVNVTTPPGLGPQARLNDTGIDWCADTRRNRLPCPLSGYPKQDGEVGRDESAHDDSDGHAGFSFTKLDAKGNALAADATVWSCVRDNVTGLVWEEKTDDNGLHDKDWTYSWYNSNAAINGGSPGRQNGGSCRGSPCDTRMFVASVNIYGLCGTHDWRMPTVSELLSIVNYDRSGPAIEPAFFRNMPSGYASFWASPSYAKDPTFAWAVRFDNGFVESNYKINGEYVRLVRGAP